MQYSLYAFVPFAILLGIALIAACVSLWPGIGRAAQPQPAATPRRSAEIYYLPSRPHPIRSMQAARSGHAAEGS